MKKEIVNIGGATQVLNDGTVVEAGATVKVEAKAADEMVERAIWAKPGSAEAKKGLAVIKARKDRQKKKAETKQADEGTKSEQ